MSSHKHHEKLESVKEAIKGSEHLNEDQKSNTIQHIDEWIVEDKAEGTLVEELLNMVAEVRPILEEAGLL